MSARARRRDRLHLRAAGAQQDPALVVAVDVDRRVDPAKLAFVREALDRNRRRIGNFFAEEPEDLLADELGGEKALVAVGDRVGVEQRGAGRQQLARFGEERVERPRPSPRSPARSRRTDGAPRAPPSAAAAGRGPSAGRPCSARQSPACLPAAGGSPRDRRPSCARPRRRDRGVDVGDALAHRPVHPIVQARAVLRLESRRVDEHELGVRRVVTIPVTRWRVVCALREVMVTRAPTRRLTSVDLPDIRPADDRDEAAPEMRRVGRDQPRRPAPIERSPPHTRAPPPPAPRRGGSARCPRRRCRAPGSGIRS